MIRTIIAIALCTLAVVVNAQSVIVDKDGVMRWSDTKKEVYGFGINYTVPFAHAYRTAGKLGVDREKAIDEDVYHFARLGFDAFRVHVWDTEISDSVGNLLENDHLRLFDYQLAKMKERGMKMVLTPIAFWGNGWPERDEKTPGFSHKYGKDACLTNEEAIKAQEKYLYQFLNHVNQYTKIAYKDDPAILAFEVSNEPHHRGSEESVTRYINRMVAAMKKTGTRKPVFYNISHSVHMADAYFRSDIQGGTFQWYPTGLGARHELRGNFLPNVDLYDIPFASHKGFKSRAKMVYEFDAADVGRSYIYPAMARSFRTAGIQWGAHFSYDPTFMAYANTEYNTHYMNLVYTPGKAIALKISSEVFHRVPRYRSYGRYPENTTFGEFRVSYENDLAEMVTPEKFFYSNTTGTSPDRSKLVSIAGVGSSPVVSYEGTGAYFLDRVAAGVWRLEVLPDAIWIGNPFGRNSLRKTIAVINWRSWPMKIDVPELGSDFGITSLSGKRQTRSVNDGSFEIEPGVYLLVGNGVRTDLNAESKWNNISLGEFAAPQSTVKQTYVVHRPPLSVTEGKPLRIEATIVTREEPASVMLFVASGRGAKPIPLKKERGYLYSATIPAEVLQGGFLQYHIVVEADGKSFTFPSGAEGMPYQWDFYENATYRVGVVPETSGIVLFDPSTDADEISGDWQKAQLQVVPGREPGTEILNVSVRNLKPSDPENPNADPAADFTFRYNFANRVAGRSDRLASATELVVRATATGERTLPVQVALVTRQGFAYGATVMLEPGKSEYVVSLSGLKPVPLVILPRPYPTFLPYYFANDAKAPAFEAGDAETIQISVGKGLDPEAQKPSFSISRILIR